MRSGGEPSRAVTSSKAEAASASRTLSSRCAAASRRRAPRRELARRRAARRATRRARRRASSEARAKSSGRRGRLTLGDVRARSARLARRPARSPSSSRSSQARAKAQSRLTVRSRPRAPPRSPRSRGRRRSAARRLAPAAGRRRELLQGAVEVEQLDCGVGGPGLAGGGDGERLVPRAWRPGGPGRWSTSTRRITVAATPKKCAAVPPVDSPLVDQAQIRFVHQRGGLQRVPATLARELAPRHPPEVGVEQPEQPLRALGLARAPGAEQIGHLGDDGLPSFFAHGVSPASLPTVYAATVDGRPGSLRIPVAVAAAPRRASPPAGAARPPTR